MGLQCIKFLCYVGYDSLHGYNFVVKVIKNGRRQVKHSLVRI